MCRIGALALIEDCMRPERDSAAPQALCVRPASLSKKGKSLQLEDADYSWRPRILEHVPFYFCPALCTVQKNGFPALPWHCEFTPAAGGHTAEIRKNVYVSAEGTWAHASRCILLDKFTS